MATVIKAIKAPKITNFLSILSIPHVIHLLVDEGKLGGISATSYKIDYNSFFGTNFQIFYLMEQTCSSKLYIKQ
jgi:hypothetical protein